MSSLVRNTAFWVGVALTALGGGNWINGQSKIEEYRALAVADAGRPEVVSPEGFRNLTPRTNASLLRPLRPRISTRSIAQGKEEFYRVVSSGGRALTGFGVTLMVISLLRQRRHGRGRPQTVAATL